MDDNTNGGKLITRRDLVRYGMYGAASLVLADGVASPALAARMQAAPRPTGKAKGVIQIWLWGGACHLDTFDPKPGAGSDYTGPLDKPIATNVAGMQICELLPELAKHGEKYSLIRSLTHGSFAHETAAYMVQTGRDPGDGQVYPGAGAVVSLFKGYDAGYKGLIPPYVVLTTLQGRFSESGFLGSRAKPFATGGDPNQARFAVEGVVAAGITDQRQRDRRELMHNLNALDAALHGNPQLAALNDAERQAYELILGDGGKVFDLSQEKDDLRTLYGKSTFGQSCLVARRLVERGVPFVTINYQGWDTHKEHFPIMRRKLPELDKGLSTLLADLAQRGLLDSTIVWCSGEFGRTPKVMWEAPWNGGRGHYGSVFSALLAGGGFKGGQIIGASDARGEQVAERPVHPRDILRSMYVQLGIEPSTRLPHPQGLPVTVLPPADSAAKSGGLLAEIM